jgi:hypothetical protein
MELKTTKRREGWSKVPNTFTDQYMRHLDGSATKVYLCLKSHVYGKKNSCYPTNRTLAEKCGLDRRTIIRHVKTLEKYKIISVKRSRGGNNIYIFNVSSNWEKIDEITIEEGSVMGVTG